MIKYPGPEEKFRGGLERDAEAALQCGSVFSFYQNYTTRVQHMLMLKYINLLPSQNFILVFQAIQLSSCSSVVELKYGCRRKKF